MLGPVDGLAELTVVRHGESTANAAFARAEAVGLVDAGVDRRDADVPLTDLGRAQADSFGRWLATRGRDAFPDVAFCSPFRRARDTLTIALGHVRGRALPEVVVDARLRDREMGELYRGLGLQAVALAETDGRLDAARAAALRKALQ